MKNLKKLAATLTLTGIIMIGVSNANAGILIGDLTVNEKNACSETNFTGIIMSDLTGAMINGFVGIIMSDLSSSPRGCVIVDHGILLGD